MRRCKLRKRKVEEIRLGNVIAARNSHYVVRHARSCLSENGIYSSHILTVESTEVMSCAARCFCVLIHIFYDVTYVHHTVVTAPIAELPTEILAVSF